MERNTKLYNWNNVYTTIANTVYIPSTVEEIQTIVKNAREQHKTITVSGSTRHCWNALSLTTLDNIQILTTKLDALVDITDTSVTVQSGMTLSQLNKLLARRGKALKNLPNADVQTVGGIVATGSHGSGWFTPQTFSNFVQKVTFVDGLGDIRVARKGESELEALVCNLGALGIIIDITLDVVPAFDILEQRIKLADINIPRRKIVEELENYPYSEINYIPSTGSVTFLRRSATEPNFNAWSYLSSITDYFTTVVSNISAQATQLIPKFPYIASHLLQKSQLPSYQVLSYNIGPRSYPFKQSTSIEFAFNLDDYNEVVPILDTLVKKYTSQFFIMCTIRFDYGGNGLLLMNSNRHTFWFDCIVATSQIPATFIREVSDIAMKFKGRPHWGKAERINRQMIDQTYGKEIVNYWIQLKNELDPHNVFWNSTLQTWFGDL